jgi:hypothetical protein
VLALRRRHVCAAARLQSLHRGKSLVVAVWRAVSCGSLSLLGIAAESSALGICLPCIVQFHAKGVGLRVWFRADNPLFRVLCAVPKRQLHKRAGPDALPALSRRPVCGVRWHSGRRLFCSCWFGVLKCFLCTSCLGTAVMFVAIRACSPVTVTCHLSVPEASPFEAQCDPAPYLMNVCRSARRFCYRTLWCLLLRLPAVICLRC